MCTAQGCAQRGEVFYMYNSLLSQRLTTTKAFSSQ
jgi:hypothetical protein